MTFLKEDDEDDDYTKECGNDDIRYRDPENKTGERTADEQCEYVKASEDESGKEYTEDECQDSHI